MFKVIEFADTNYFIEIIPGFQDIVVEDKL